LGNVRAYISQHTHEFTRKRSLVTLTREKGDGFAALSSSTRSATSVDKVLCPVSHRAKKELALSLVLTGGQGEGYVEHQADVRNIQTSGSDVCSDENVDSASLELLQSFESGILAQVSVQTSDGVTRSSDGLLESLGLLFVQCKDEDTCGSGGGRRMRFEVLLEVEEHSTAG
jgi:hypothetical protein